MADTEVTGSEETVTFRGRIMRFQRPEPLQIALWRRTAVRFGRMKNKTGEELKQEETIQEFDDLLDRLFSIVFSSFPDRQDKTWLEIEMIEGRLTAEDLLEIVTKFGAGDDGQARLVEG